MLTGCRLENIDNNYNNNNGYDYNYGDNGNSDDNNGKKTINMGSYPQTEVNDSTLTSALNEKAGSLPTSDNSQS